MGAFQRQVLIAQVIKKKKKTSRLHQHVLEYKEI